MRSIFILFLYSISVESQENATLSDLDSVLANLLAFGDNYTLPLDKIEASYLCDRFNELKPLSDNFSHPLFRLVGIKKANEFMTVTTVCELYEKSPKEMTIFAAEVNSKSDKFSEIYQNITNFGANIGEGETGKDFCDNFPLMNCYFLKWFEGVNNQLTIPSQIIFKQIFQYYLDFTTKFEIISDCDWSDIPRASNIQFKAINLGLLAGLTKCFNRYKFINE